MFITARSLVPSSWLPLNLPIKNQTTKHIKYRYRHLTRSFFHMLTCLDINMVSTPLDQKLAFTLGILWCWHPSMLNDRSTLDRRNETNLWVTMLICFATGRRQMITINNRTIRFVESMMLIHKLRNDSWIIYRIAPLPPHWVVNVVAPHLGIGVIPFWASTFLGIMGVTVIHTTIGG